MREIKFRLWCKDLEEMTEIEKMGFENNQLWYIGCIDHDKEETYFPENDDHVLMQYTGLKDKNGKEIFEGDIVLLKNEFATWKGTVIFDEGAFKLSINHSYGNSKNHFSKTDEFNDMGARIQLNNIYVVVGNIYENPELLGDSQ